ncbi:hypothetical protein L1987_29381 [Smallanthus sonchifolius]|uniref:Uncharacterized protein n=1 Tax=Smallanthus sonchifolius TaxID=185202 RepID=A0ACB9HZQ6_9ASTR|nr:hypothetical protein L1987_29381 [Smallanthus sonchifolius]
MSQPLLQMPTSSTLSFSSHIPSHPNHTFLTSRFSHLSIAKPPPSTTIRMGGGPRTYPGGVSKWQWKRMQTKKAKQLLRARLARERQIYEMRKRAELNAAVSELERPWEVVEKAPKLFSVTADEQLKVLADRFQKPGGFDLWSEKDGPQLFETVEGLPSARFFPKGVVHSIKPYGRIGNSHQESDLVPGQDSGLDQRNTNEKSVKLDGLNQREIGEKIKNGGREQSGLNSKVFDMNLQDDGSYGVSKEEYEITKNRRKPERK